MATPGQDASFSCTLESTVLHLRVLCHALMPVLGEGVQLLHDDHGVHSDSGSRKARRLVNKDTESKY